MLEINNITVRRGKKTVLDGLSLEIKGGFTAVIGKNGCGKSTLVSAIGGVLPYAGSIRANGHEIRETKPRERARILTVLPQMLAFPRITVYELIMMGRNAHIPLGAGPTAADREAVLCAAEKTGMHCMLRRYASELSGGEGQRAYLAAVLAAETDIIVLDEPTAYADMHFARELCKLLHDISASEGKTVIAVMHGISLAASAADRIAVLDKGKIIAHLPTEELLETDIIEKTFDVNKYKAESAVFFG